MCELVHTVDKIHVIVMGKLAIVNLVELSFEVGWDWVLSYGVFLQYLGRSYDRDQKYLLGFVDNELSNTLQPLS